MAVYAASADPRKGHLLFLREGTLLAQVFDERSLQLQGDLIPVAERVESFHLSGLFSVSPSGVLAYSAGPTALWLSQLSWFDRQGKQLDHAEQPGTYSYTDFALSPDGKRLAASKIDPKAGGETGIWLVDLLRGVSSRFTFDLAPDSAPVWSPTAAEWPLLQAALAGMRFIRRLAMAPEKSSHWSVPQATQSFRTIGRATGASCSTLSRILKPIPIYGSCLWQVTGHRLAQPDLLQIRRSARIKADSLLTHVGSLMLRTSPVDPKSIFNLFRRHRTAAARLQSPVMVAASRDGGGMARNCSILPRTEN
jgi:hypothetical protein